MNKKLMMSTLAAVALMGSVAHADDYTDCNKTGMDLYKGGNYTEALKSFECAASAGNEESMYNIGYMIMEGLVPASNKKIDAYKWLELSVQYGRSASIDARDELLWAMNASEKKAADQKVHVWLSQNDAYGK